MIKTKEKTIFENDIETITRFGICSNKYNQELNTSKFDQGVCLSSENENTSFSSSVVLIKNVDEFKLFSGISDVKIRNRNLATPSFTPPVYSKEKFPEINDIMKFICPAHEYYAYCDSDRVNSYKRILNKVYYPMAVKVFYGERLIISSGKPLILKGQHPISLIFKQVIVEKDSQIIWETGGKLTSSSLDIEGALTLINSAPKGSDGVTGNPAKNGNNGQSGEQGLPINLSTEYINGTLHIISKGGDGGDGGDGGLGGNGGDGGQGGNGGNIYVEYTSGNPVFTFSKQIAQGGNGGALSKNSKNTNTNIREHSGKNGYNGLRGQVFINGEFLK